MKHPGSTFYHQIKWKNVVERTFHHKPLYLVARENNEIVGILPLFVIRIPFIGSKVVSIPFTSYGSVCATDDVVEGLLVKKAIEITKEHKAKYLELRQTEKKDFGLITTTKYNTFILEMGKNEKVLWDSLDKRVRWSIRRAENLHHVIKIGNDIDTFYALYSRCLHDLGTPTEGRKFFNNVFKEFKNQMEIAIVEYDGIPVTAGLFFYFRDKIIYDRGAPLQKYKSLNFNSLLLWEMIKKSNEEGYKFFDLGRSIQNSKTYLFKKHWHANPIVLNYQYFLYRDKQVPDLSQNNPKRQMFAHLWRKIPFPITNYVGPLLRKNFP